MKHKNDTIDELNLFSRLFFFGVASLAKSIIFRSIANQSQKNNDLISATISGYYSLLHMAISLMYFCHKILFPEQRNKLMKIIDTEGCDPTETIKHEHAINFIKQCVHRNLDRLCLDTFELGKRLREYVNYGPRLSFSNDTPIFGDCGITPGNLDDFISSIDDCIIKAMQWAKNHSTTGNFSFIKLAIDQITQFFENKDLFYPKWCNEDILSDAKLFYEKIKLEVHI
jgi:hypothetical protein